MVTAQQPLPPPDSQSLPRRGARTLAGIYPSCPKCGGQYRREGRTCQCYMCSFSWDVREEPAGVADRARRRPATVAVARGGGAETHLPLDTRQARVRAIKAGLRSLLSSDRPVYPLNSDRPTETGREYSEQAVQAAELLWALTRCTPRQRRILELSLGDDRLSHAAIARRLGTSLGTVKRDSAGAIALMLRQIGRG